MYLCFYTLFQLFQFGLGGAGDIQLDYVEIPHLKELLVDVPKLLKVQREAVAGLSSKHQGSSIEAESILVELCEFIIFEVFQEKPKVDLLHAFAVVFESQMR